MAPSTTFSGPAAILDPAHTVFTSDSNPLDAMFNPKTVAVVGATDKADSVGRTLLWNLISSPFGGTVYPVNPKRKSVLGIPAYPELLAIEDAIDLVVIVTPPPSVPGIMRQCVEKGVKAAIIISAGFKETGEEGAALEQEVLAIAREGNIRIVGPNCLGVMNPTSGLNATFANSVAQPGNIAFISQSGALCTAVLDWSYKANIGFSSFVSVGSMLDVDWGDLIHYLGDDPKTRSILIYMESIGNAASFLSAAREVSLNKPIIVIKPGRTEAASEAAASHTGSMTGSDDMLDAAFRRSGVLRVDSIDELFSMAEVLDKQTLPKGPRLSIVTNAGGPGVLATDALIRAGGELSPVNEATMARLNELLPAQWSHGNPIDVLGDASPERYVEALKLVAESDDNDAVLVILTPQAMTNPSRTAELIAEAAKDFKKPLLASWMGGRDIAVGEAILDKACIPTFEYPDLAAKAFAYMSQHSKNIQMLYETPTMQAIELNPRHVEQGRHVIANAQKEGRYLLSEWESKQVLAAYDVPVTRTELATTAEEAVEAAREIGFPVVLKLHSHTITHKTDVGGIQLNLTSEELVREAFESILENVKKAASEADFLGVTVQPMIRLKGTELIIGSVQDAQFGPTMVFGAGGQMVEIFQDIAHALPPLTSTLARGLIEETKVAKVLKGFRGTGAVDQQALQALLVRFSRLIVELSDIEEIEINPLMASPDGLIALDARIVLKQPGSPKVEPAILPYPRQYEKELSDREGKPYRLRPIRPEDELAVRRFHEGLTADTVSAVYGRPVLYEERVTHQRLSRVCFNDYRLELALVIESLDEVNKGDIAGVARLSRVRHTPSEARFRFLMADGYQGKGLGRALMENLITAAKAEGVKNLSGLISQTNYKVQPLLESLGFQVTEEEGTRRLYTLDL